MRIRHWFTLLVFLAAVVGWFLDRSRPDPVPAPAMLLPAPLSQRDLGQTATDSLAGSNERTLSGSVLDSDGNPIAEAAVLRRAADHSSWSITGVDGAFELHDLPAGALVLEVLPWPWMPARFDVAADSEQVELRIEGPPPQLPRLEPFAHSDARGVLRNAAGDPLAKHEIVLVPTEYAAPQSALELATLVRGRLPRRVETQSDGSFAIAGLVAGSYDIEVRPPWARGGSWPDLLDPLTAPHEHTAQAGPLELATAVGSISGSVVDNDGTAVEGALLIARLSDERGHLWPPQTTDPEGSFSIRGLPPARYDLEVLAGEAALVLAEIVVTAGEVSTPAIPPLEISAREEP